MNLLHFRKALHIFLYGRKICVSIFLLLLTGHLRAEIITYPVPTGTEASAYYAVKVTQKTNEKQAFVYITHAQKPEFNRSQTTSFCLFAFDGKVSVTVSRLKGVFQKCRILPSSYGIQVVKNGNSVTFELDRPRKIAIEFDDDLTHPMLLFADAPETNIPSPQSPDVIYFAPGVHDLSNPIEPKSGQTIYLAAGAIVNGLIQGNNVNHVTICGRGILAGRKYGHTGNRHIVFGGEGSTDIRIEDITLVDSPGFYITTSGARTHVKNVKGMGWWFNTDGISTGSDGLIEDCFLKCNDDAIKLYHSGTKVYRTTIWQMENGAPFQLSWNMNSDNKGFLVKDCDVIHVDHTWDNPNEGVFAAIHGGSGHMSDYTFEDIRIENANWRLINLQILPNRFAHASKLGQMSDIIFRNITVTTTHLQPLKRINVIQGYDSQSKISHVIFENLKINGKYIHHATEGHFEYNSKTSESIQFRVTAAEPKTSTRRKTPSAHLLTWKNPIREGLNSYGQKDFFVWAENNQYYLVATEQQNPEWNKRGIILYRSENLKEWYEETYLINRNTVDTNAWYRDEWAAPEVHKIKGKYYLTFHCRNNKLRPYKKLGFGIAVADKLTGPYTIITSQPLFYGNNTTLLENTDGKVYAYWDLDGRLYAAELDVSNGQWKTQPQEILGPATLKNEYRFLDAPFVMRRGNRYYLMATSFYAGYVVRVRYWTSSSPLGPWSAIAPDPLMTFLEAEADEVTKMPYPPGNSFAPPTQVIFQHQLFAGPDGKYYMAYHSSDKYSEPYLCIEPVEFDQEGKIILKAPKKTDQQVLLRRRE